MFISIRKINLDQPSGICPLAACMVIGVFQ